MKLYWNQLFGAYQHTPQGYDSFNSALKKQATHIKHTNNISHSHTLIADLKNDHQVIFNIYTEIFTAIEIEQFENIPKILEHFKHCLQLHLIQENTQFYAYIEQYYAKESERLKTIELVQQNLKRSSTHIFQFIRAWEDQRIDEFNLLEFSQEYKYIGQILMQQLAQEENHLYTLYPPYINES